MKGEALYQPLVPDTSRLCAVVDTNQRCALRQEPTSIAFIPRTSSGTHSAPIGVCAGPKTRALLLTLTDPPCGRTGQGMTRLPIVGFVFRLHENCFPS
ncbi:MAG: hypothetical protein QOG17_3246 [Gammaproteobacteria bacterium]|nr:hypothetical protein [Gammaproteobacteria bacterium]